jgi:hypothetical protein
MAIVSKRYGSEADDSTGPARSVEIPADGEARVIEDAPAGVQLDALFRDLTFMEEKVQIVLHPVNDGQNTTRLVSVGNNGVKQYIMAGTPQWIKRKFVAQLIKARPDIIYHQSDDPSAERLNMLTRQSTSRYNFDVVEDSARGKTWLNEYRRRWAGV